MRCLTRLGLAAAHRCVDHTRRTHEHLEELPHEVGIGSVQGQQVAAVDVLGSSRCRWPERHVSQRNAPLSQRRLAVRVEAAHVGLRVARAYTQPQLAPTVRATGVGALGRSARQDHLLRGVVRQEAHRVDVGLGVALRTHLALEVRRGRPPRPAAATPLGRGRGFAAAVARSGTTVPHASSSGARTRPTSICRASVMSTSPATDSGARSSCIVVLPGLLHRGSLTCWRRL